MYAIIDDNQVYSYINSSINMTKCIYSYYRVITGQTDIDLKKLYSFIESNGGIDFVKVVFIITFESYYSYLKIPQYHGDGIVIDILNNFSQY